MGSDLRLSESNLRLIRRTFYKGISEGLYTGYNLYESEYPVRRFSVDYFHSELTSKHKHFRELNELLEEEGFLQTIPTIQARKVDKPLERRATYATLPSWRKGKRGKRFRFFTIEGEEISYEKALKTELPLIGEATEYNLVVHTKNENELNELLSMFVDKVSKFVLNSFGTISRNERGGARENEGAIYNSDEIPAVTTRVRPRNRKDLVRVTKFDIPFSIKTDKAVIISTLARKGIAGSLRHIC